MFSDSQLSTLYDCATTSKRIPSDFADCEKELETVIRYGEIFKLCSAENSAELIRKSEDLDSNEKRKLEQVVNQKLREATKNEETLEWNVNIVIANSDVPKSLRPIINIRMPDGQLFEFDIDSFAQFRQQLARTVLTVNPQ